MKGARLIAYVFLLLRFTVTLFEGKISRTGDVDLPYWFYLLPIFDLVVCFYEVEEIKILKICSLTTILTMLIWITEVLATSIQHIKR